MKVVLTVAGTDPSGAAGITADLQVIREHQCYGVSVVTAVLAQNTSGVRLVHSMPEEVLRAQLAAIFDDFDVAAVKVGLVPTAAHVRAVVEMLPDVPIVWDPVLRSGDGRTALFGGDAGAVGQLLSRVSVFTPNIPEAEQLLGVTIADRDAAHAAAMSLPGAGVLLKVGHLGPGADGYADIWADGGGAFDLEALPAVGMDVRGTGCHLATSIACFLAGGTPPLVAAGLARRYLNRSLHERVQTPGRGRPVIVHD